MGTKIHPRLDKEDALFLFNLIADDAYESVAPEGFVFICLVLGKGKLIDVIREAARLCGLDIARILRFIMGPDKAAALTVKNKYPKNQNLWNLAIQRVSPEQYPEVGWLWSMDS